MTEAYEVVWSGAIDRDFQRDMQRPAPVSTRLVSQDYRDSMRQICDYLWQEPGSRRGEIRKGTGLNVADVNGSLYQMLKKGQVHTDGAPRYARFYVTP